MTNATNAAVQTVTRVNFRIPRLYTDKKSGARYPGLYVDGAGVYYERPSLNGRQVFRKLQATTPAIALKEITRRRDQLAKHLAGEPGIENPYIKTATAATVADLCDLYLQSGCPKKKNKATPRSQQTNREEKTRVTWLKKWWGKIEAHKVEPGDCIQYHAWRAPQVISKKGGDRQVEKELVTLSQIFWWATQNSKRTGIKTNPLRNDRPKFRNESQVEHCREHQPASAEELHAIARLLFQVKRSQVLGWQVLLEAMIGARSSHLLQLRWDAQNEKQAGYIKKARYGRKLLYLYNNAGSTKGTNEYIEIHPALDQALDALRDWRDKNFPESPWFFPSPEDPQKPLDPTSLTHALTRVSAALQIGKRTSHGLRSYFVNVHRSRGLDDAKIALLIGHKSLGKLIVDVYGSVPEEELGWLPKEGEPAWAQFQRGRMIQQELSL